MLKQKISVKQRSSPGARRLNNGDHIALQTVRHCRSGGEANIFTEDELMWYVIWTTTGKEDQCKALMERYCKEFVSRVTIPKKKVQKKYKGEWKDVEERLIPSYVFVETTEVDTFGPELKNLSWYAGFNNLLKSDGTYMPLNDREVKLISSLSGFEKVIEPSIGVKEGENILITKGPLMGLEGFIKHINRHKREAVLEMDICGRKTKVTVGLEVVDKK